MEPVISPTTARELALTFKKYAQIQHEKES